jgi:hypothetical protein
MSSSNEPAAAAAAAKEKADARLKRRLPAKTKVTDKVSAGEAKRIDTVNLISAALLEPRCQCITAVCKCGSGFARIGTMLYLPAGKGHPHSCFSIVARHFKYTATESTFFKDLNTGNTIGPRKVITRWFRSARSSRPQRDPPHKCKAGNYFVDGKLLEPARPDDRALMLATMEKPEVSVRSTILRALPRCALLSTISTDAASPSAR